MSNWQCSNCKRVIEASAADLCKGYCFDATGNSCNGLRCECGEKHWWTGSISPDFQTRGRADMTQVEPKGKDACEHGMHRLNCPQCPTPTRRARFVLDALTAVDLRFRAERNRDAFMPISGAAFLEVLDTIDALKADRDAAQATAKINRITAEEWRDRTQATEEERDAALARVAELEREVEGMGWELAQLRDDCAALKAENQRMRERQETLDEIGKHQLAVKSAALARVAKLEQALELIASPKRPDGTYNRSREACEQIAREALCWPKGSSAGIEVIADPSLNHDQWQLRDPNTGKVLYESDGVTTRRPADKLERGEG
jgi:hypothetical protein